MRSQLQSRLDRASHIAQERESIGAQLDELRQRETTLHDELAAFTSQIDPAEAQLRELEIDQNRLEGEERSARNRLSDLESLYNQAMLDMARREEELNHLRARIDEELGLVRVGDGRSQRAAAAAAEADRVRTADRRSRCPKAWSKNCSA